MKKNYYLGVFYYNPADPLFFVRKENNLGWTINFGHWKKIAFSLVILFLIFYFVS